MGMDAMDTYFHSTPVDNEPLLVSLSFQNSEWRECLWINLGTCGRCSTPGRLSRWAQVHIKHRGDWSKKAKRTHKCAVDHIEVWPEFAKTFGDSERTIRLSFMPCQDAPEDTFVLHLELRGSVYEKLQRDRNIHFPPPGMFATPRALE